MPNPARIHELIAERASSNALVEEVLIGLTWTLARSEVGSGLAMSPGLLTRTLPWSGALRGKQVDEFMPWLHSWNPFEATVAMAVANSVINSGSTLLQTATPIINSGSAPANLAVFDYFSPLLKGQRVAVVGRYPGLERYQQSFELTVFERQPGSDDLPDSACEFVLPEADWVFLTASSIVNKTFPRLAELSQQAVLVLMGPTVPWLAELAEFGVDFVAGVQIADAPQLHATVAEGGGTRIFGPGVNYCVAATCEKSLAHIRGDIAHTATERNDLKIAMEEWYAGSSKGRYPGYGVLELVGDELSLLDSRYKRLWDAQQHLNKR